METRLEQMRKLQVNRKGIANGKERKDMIETKRKGLKRKTTRKEEKVKENSPSELKREGTNKKQAGK
eukprot:scaffold176293_cov13-Prasinocladus_malaysianus.AAC.1